MGIVSSMNEELWGVAQGLKLAWQRGFRVVVLEVDSFIVIELIKKGTSMIKP